MSHQGLLRFLLLWAVNSLSLWVADGLFERIEIQTAEALFLSGLLLGILNAVVRPLLILLTLPLTVVSLGLFLLIVNALVLQMVAMLVPGFHVEGFWNVFVVAMFVSVFGFLVNGLIGVNRVSVMRSVRRDR
jgi:putative membrane protein